MNANHIEGCVGIPLFCLKPIPANLSDAMSKFVSVTRAKVIETDHIRAPGGFLAGAEFQIEVARWDLEVQITARAVLN